MAYRRTERVIERLAGRREDILRAARETAAGQGLAGVQIVPVAERAGIAAGTVYRYFPTKADLVAALLATMLEREIAALRSAAAAAPGPLSALAAIIVTFSARSMGRGGALVPVLSAPAEPEFDRLRAAHRQALVGEIEMGIRVAIVAGQLGDQDVQLAAAGVFGMLVGCSAGAPIGAGDADCCRSAAQVAALLALRALGIPDARARGLIVQAPWPHVPP